MLNTLILGDRNDLEPVRCDSAKIMRKVPIYRDGAEMGGGGHNTTTTSTEYDNQRYYAKSLNHTIPLPTPSQRSEAIVTHHSTHTRSCIRGIRHLSHHAIGCWSSETRDWWYNMNWIHLCLVLDTHIRVSLFGFLPPGNQHFTKSKTLYVTVFIVFIVSHCTL